MRIRRPKGAAASGFSAQWAPAWARRCSTCSAAAKMAASMVPIEGVVPAAVRFAPSSARSAPARAEILTPSTSSTQVSRTTWLG